jgi:hypothetical protein
MTRHRLFNIATAIVYTLALVVLYLDLMVWRP